MGGKASRDKGKRGEREAAKFMREEWGIDAFRGRQYQGGDDSPDVKHQLKEVFVEVKRTEALSLYPAMSQANSDAPIGDVPALLHRRNGKEWLMVIYAADLPRLAARYLRSIGVEVVDFDGKLF